MSNKTPTIIITGASGFIGSHLVETALKQGFNVYAGVRQSSNKQYLNDPRIKFIDLNYDDVDTLTLQLTDLCKENNGIDYIIHNAGITKATKLSQYDRINHQYCNHLVQAIKNSKVCLKKFILISSLSAQGPGSEDTNKPIKLEDKPHPLTAYGASKLAAENYLKSQNLPYIIIRPTVVYGPRDKDVFVFFKLIKRHLEIYVGSHKQMLSFIYVKDLVRVIFTAMLSDKANKTYFVSDGNPYDSQAFSDMIKKEIKAKTVKIHIPLFLVKCIAKISDLINRATNTPSPLSLDKVKELESVNWYCDANPLVKDFDFKPEYPLKKGLKETFEWYKFKGWL